MSVNAVNLDGSLLRVAGGTLYADAPIGAIIPYGGATAPSGWLLCQGQAISRTDYSDLFNAIGIVFGSGDGSTTFNVPDYRGKVPFGADADNAIGTDENGALPNIKGGITGMRAGNGGTPNGCVQTTGSAENVSTWSGTYGGWNIDASRSSTLYKDGQTTVVPANIRVNYIIKAKQVAVPIDFIDAINDVFKVSEPVSATKTKYTTNGSIIWKRSGKVVEVTFSNVAFASQTSGNVTLATGLPPSNNYSWSIIKSLTDASVQQGVAVNTNGNLTSIGGSTGGSSYYDSFTYLAAD